MQVFMRHTGPLPTVLRQVPEGFAVREASLADDQQLSVVLTDAFQETWDTQRVRDVLLQAADVVRTWVVVRDDEIVGTASERDDERYPGDGYVHWVGVLPSVAGHGLGALITEACLVGSSERGLTTAVLATDDFRQAAIRAYLRLGFLPEYRSDEERQGWTQAFRQLTHRRDANSGP